MASGPRIVAVKSGVLELTLPKTPLFVPEQARTVVAEIGRDYVELALQYIAGVVAEEAPRDKGHLAQSFLANPAGPTGGLEVLGYDPRASILGRVFSSLPYAIVIDQGRAAGKPISRAGQAAIALWVRRKLGLSGREARNAAYAIAWSIRTRGLAGTHFARRGFAKAAPRVEQIFRELNAAIAQGLTAGGSTPAGGAA